MADGFAKMKGWAESCLDVAAADARCELGTLKFDFGVLVDVLVGRHGRASARPQDLGRAARAPSSRYSGSALRLSHQQDVGDERHNQCMRGGATAPKLII